MSGSASASSSSPGGNSIVVLNPMGYPPAITQRTMAPRPGTLDGKTVYLVDCRFDDGDIFLQQMEHWFHEHMPAVRTEFRQKSGVYTEDDPQLWEEIRARGAVAVVGVGH